MSRRGSAIVYDLSPFDGETTTIDYNVIWHFGQPVRIYVGFYGRPGFDTWIYWEQWQLGFRYDAHSIIADPLFIDPERDNYQLGDNSAAYNLGFKRIPVKKIGLYADEIRSTPLPPPDPRRDGTEWSEHIVKMPFPETDEEPKT